MTFKTSDITTEQRASDLVDAILNTYNNSDITDKRAVGVMIDEALEFFDQDMAEAVYNDVLDRYSSGMGITKTIPKAVPSYVDLSDLMYNNSGALGRSVAQILKHDKYAQSTAQEISKLIYDGYGAPSIMDVFDKGKLPEYVHDFMDSGDFKDFYDQMRKIKTRPYQIALEDIMDAWDKQVLELQERAIKELMEEKARYYADRIAKTEIQRAKTLGQGQDMLGDKNIKLVKWQLSSRHKIFDICDYYNRLDVGYGAGIFPKAQYPAIPLHPFCMCKVVPYYHAIKKRRVKDPTKDLFDQLTYEQQRAIAGSHDKLSDWYSGTPLIDILNKARPKYPITPMAQALKDMTKIPPITLVIPPIDTPDDFKIRDTSPNAVAFGYPDGIYDDLVIDIREDAKKIINKYPDPKKITPFGLDAHGSYYKPDLYKQPDGTLGTLVLRDGTDARVFLHEYGHHLDIATVSGAGEGWYIPQSTELGFLNARKADIAHLKSLFGHPQDMMLHLSKQWSGYEKFRGASDMLDSITAGKFHDVYGMAGHGKTYFKTQGARQAESFANLFQGWSQQGRVWKNIEKYFPNQAREFEKLMEELLK